MARLTSKETAKKERTIKKKKDPNAPKPPLGPYLRFCNQMRNDDADLKKLSVGEQGKKLSELWAKVDQITKDKYKEEYESDKRAFNERMEAYKKTDDYKKWAESNKDEKGKSGKKKAKKSSSAYNYFFKEQYAIVSGENKGASMTEITSLVAKKWKQLDDNDKKPYKEKADKHNKENAEKANAVEVVVGLEGKEE